MFEKTKLLATTLLASLAIGCSSFSSPSIEERLAAQQEKHEERMAEMQKEWKEKDEEREAKNRMEKLQQELVELREKHRRELDAAQRKRDRQQRREEDHRAFEQDYAAQEDTLYNEVYNSQDCTFDGFAEAPSWICDTGKYRDPNGAKFAFIAVGASSTGKGSPMNHRIKTSAAQARGNLADEVASFVGTKYEGSTQTTSETTDNYDYTYTESEARETIKGAYKLTHIIDPTGIVWSLFAIPNDFSNMTRRRAQKLNPSMRGNETAMYQMFQHQKLKEGIANGRLAQPQLQNNQ